MDLRRHLPSWYAFVGVRCLAQHKLLLPLLLLLLLLLLLPTLVAAPRRRHFYSFFLCENWELFITNIRE